MQVSRITGIAVVFLASGFLLAAAGIYPAVGQQVSPWIRGKTIPEPPVASREFIGIIIRSGVNVRSAPGFHCDVIDRFNLGAEVSVYRKVGPWYEVDLKDNVSGWLSSRYVHKKTGVHTPSTGVTRELSPFGITVETAPIPAALRGYISGNRVNVRENPSRDGAFVTKVSRGQDVEIVEETGEWTRIKLVGDRHGWVFAELIQEKSRILGTVTGNGVNVRSEGGIYFDVVTKVYKNMELPIIDKKGEWYQVVLPDSKVGWIVDRYFEPPLPAALLLPAGVTTETVLPPEETGLSVDEDEELLLELEFK